MLDQVAFGWAYVLEDFGMRNDLPEILLESTGYRLHRTVLSTGALFEQSLARHGVTRVQYTLLVVLHHRGRSAPLEVARLMETDAGSMTRLADRLEAKGLIVRRQSASDRRSIELELTPEGRKLVPSLKHEARLCNERYLRGLTPADRTRLFRILDTIRENCLDAREG